VDVPAARECLLQISIRAYFETRNDGNARQRAIVENDNVRFSATPSVELSNRGGQIDRAVKQLS
jgi:hypothetical protein